MERVLKREEAELQKAEAELKLAQQAFDQFLQEKDRSAVVAQKRSDSVQLIMHGRILGGRMTMHSVTFW